MLTATLCTRCGLCCDGTLLGDVELTGPAEAARLELLGLTLDDDEAGVELLALPCRALRATRCTIYSHRPQSCRTFACRLLQQAERGVVTVDHALERIAAARTQVARVKTLLDRVERRPARLPVHERYTDAVARIADAAPRGDRLAIELDAAMAALDVTIRTTFL